MPDLSMTFHVRPATVAGATYAAMMVLGEHTSSLEALDDVRITLDELLYATPALDEVQAKLELFVDQDRAKVRIALDVPDIEVHDSVTALVDNFELLHDGRSSTATFSVRW